MILANIPSQLTAPAVNIERTKYIPIELFFANMLPNTTYDAFVDNVNVNAFMKPYGGVLGGPLTAGADGKLRAQFMAGIPYKQKFLVNPVVTGTDPIISQAKTITLVDPFGNSSTGVLPFRVKSG